MALLAGLVTINVRHLMVKGKQNAARAEIATLRDAVEAFYNANGHYPTNDEGLDILTRKTDQNPDPIIRRVPLDPWNHPYQYNQPGRSDPYDIISYGADAREGGAGADADISSADLKPPGVGK